MLSLGLLWWIYSRMAIMTTTALVVGFLSLLLLLFWGNFLLQPRLPPGPRPLPILGNLLMMKKYSSLSDLAIELKRQYGPIVTFWMGSTPMIIISGPEIIQEAMIAQGSVFTGRRQLPSARITTDNFRSFTNGHGERHRFLRKLLMSGVLSSKIVAEFRPIREQEVDILVDSLKKQLHSKGGIVSNFRSLIRLTICNLVVGILLGRRLTLEEYMDLDDLIVRRFQLQTGQPSDYLPWLAWLPNNKGVKYQLDIRRKITQFFEPLIQERKDALTSGQANKPTFVDTVLGLQEGTIPSPVEILDSDIVLLLGDILSGGTDTTALNLEYCIANLINHPEVQEKLAHEISAAVGKRVVNEDDISRLPYLQAVVKEALRRHSPARLGPSRRAMSATKVAGYDIPANITVFQHLEAVSLSSEIWEDPLEFKPDRFLDNKITVDFTGTTKITMIPFGVGRRICPAMNIAFLHAEVVLARLVQAFRWKAAIPGQLLDLSPGLGLTSPMKYPLSTSLEERVVLS